MLLVQQTVRGLLHLLYPGICGLCGRLLASDEAHFCTGCRAELNDDHTFQCPRCAATIGPFAHLRGNTQLAGGVHIGNFVEVKNSKLGRGVKASHLSYLGDAEIGEGSNIGAGTITCNFDGVRKNKTTIGRNVSIGSNTSLVAPVTIGDGALTGAGSVVTKDVPSGERVAGNPARPLPKK